MDYSFLNENKIIPVVVLNSVDETVVKLDALRRGGINAAEITFRTDCAKDALSTAVKAFPDMLVGAGTVINETQCREAIAAGAKFIVSPGYSPEVAAVCKREDVPYVPGVVTPTEIIAAKADGFGILKFFPAEAYGGIKTLKALSAAFPDVKFVPTGGVEEDNLKNYLSQKFVIAAGGSFMMKGTPADIERISARATAIVKEIIG